jgi:kinesin family member C1
MIGPNSLQGEETLQTEHREALRKPAGLANITNKLATSAAVPAKAGVSFAPETQFITQKENPTPLRQKIVPSPDADATPASARRPALPPPQREHMEQQFDLLQGRLQSISTSSRRASLAGNSSTNGLKPAVCASLPPLSECDDFPAAPPREINGLAAKLESLKRADTLRQTGAQAISHQGTALEGPGQFDAHALSRCAQALFGDQEFNSLCEKGMSAQLTRSRDGATDDTKIKELAGIVKLLRRGMRETQQRMQAFVDQAVRYEKEAMQQVESVKLSGDSAAMASQAELARARREAATAAANHKSALAAWQGEIDMHKSEAATLRREMERVEGERERAKEEVRRLENARSALEIELKEVRKAQSAREREAQVDRNSAAQLLFQTKEAAERQKQELESALAAAQARADQAEQEAEGLRHQLTMAEANVQRMDSELAELTAANQALTAEKDGLHEELNTVRACLEEQREAYAKVTTNSSEVAAEAQEWQAKASELLAELRRERAAKEEQCQAAALAAEAAAAESSATAAAAEDIRKKLTAALEREAALVEEKAELKSALSRTLNQRTEAETKASAAERHAVDAEKQLATVSAERDDLTTETERLRAEASAAVARAETAQEHVAKVSREAENKAARLAQLEGELEALQECTMGLEGGDQRELLQRMVSKIASLEAAVAAAEARRREAHNQLVELKGNIRVFCRIRPHPRAVAATGPDGTSVRLLADGKEHVFGFDRVFKPETSQSQVFNEVSDVVQSALDGYKVCLFSYGQTGAGKTHTMQGGRSLGEEGIIPRAISKILSTVERLKEQGWEYSLEASYIEVYNEQLRDLLAEQGAGRITDANPIQHQSDGGHTIVSGAARMQITSEEEAAALVRRAATARAVESTAMNAVSSRSHAVFMLYITGRHEASETLLRGSLNLVDLAGSERLARSGAEGARAREACSINKSLSSLGDVFAALGSKAGHVPYRNSKLTHLLQPCLGGSGKTLMFVNINPEPESAGESLCSLRFAAKVNACETAAKGGAARHVSTLTGDAGGGGGGSTAGFGYGSGVGALEKAGRPSLTGRQSLAPGSFAARRQSIAPGGGGGSGGGAGAARRLSMIPSASGVKRGTMGPPPPLQPGSTGSRYVRPKFGQ